MSTTIWQPPVGASWQIILSNPVSQPYPQVSVLDLDLFMANKSTISALHSASIKPICYFSAGSYENWRPDASSFHPSDYGNPLSGWPGEWWLNTSSPNVRTIMTKRLDLAASIGCAGVDPDNTDGYSPDNDSGLPLTQDTAVDYLLFLARESHSRGLSIGLKNSLDIIPRVIDKMQWAVNEQCLQYDECDRERPFIDAGKPVFEIEYPSAAPDIGAKIENSICGDASRANFSTLIKEMDLGLWYYACADPATGYAGNATTTSSGGGAASTTSSGGAAATSTGASAAVGRRGLVNSAYLVASVSALVMGVVHLWL